MKTIIIAHASREEQKEADFLYQHHLPSRAEIAQAHVFLCF